jgi:beta-mannosidase
MDLGGPWQVAESNEERRRSVTAPFDAADEGWHETQVPGHWRSVPALASSDGPVLYRRRFDAPIPEPGTRAFLVFDGIFYQADVWLDGEYLGDTEGYFFPHSLEVTERLARAGTHTLAVEVSCGRPADRTAKRNLTGVFQHWDCIDPDWNPGGIWAPVHIDRCGPVRIAGLKVLCGEANEERAVLELEAVLDPATPGPVRIDTEVRPESPDGGGEQFHQQEQTLSAGPNTIRWTVAVERPALWWPRSLGGQPLYRIDVKVTDETGELTDRRSVRTGLRQVKVRNFIATVNGERLFLKGANVGPTRRDLAAASAEEVRRDVRLAADAGLDLLRVHAHITRPELYDEADRTGMLLWQDLPLQWGYGRVRRQAVVQARKAVELLGHHPSIALWCGHNEPMAVDLTPDNVVAPRTIAKVVASQVLPTWNKTGLDRSIRRALERSDGSRAVVAHSGIVPHPLWGTDSHFYFGWYHGQERDFPAAMGRFPVLARFVSEFGAQAIPESAGFMQPERWPDLDWEGLASHHSLQKEIFDQRVPPAEHRSFDGWRAATQAYQAELLRHHIETLRRLKYRPTGGFCLFMLSDPQPGVTWSILDHERVPKSAYQAVRTACAPVIVVADRMAAEYRGGDRVALAVHVVSDLRAPIEEAVIDARLEWPGGGRSWRFGGDVDADRCVRIGRLVADIPPGCPRGRLSLELQMRWSGGEAANMYQSRISSEKGM